MEDNLNLQLFADGGAASGDGAGAQAAAVQGTESEDASFAGYGTDGAEADASDGQLSGEDAMQEGARMPVTPKERAEAFEAIIKGENIPEPGIPESFKVLLKELQSLGLDVRVLRDDDSEVEIMETSEYGETDLNAIIGNDKNFAFEDSESFEKMGFTKQEFDAESEELVDVEEEPSEEEPVFAGESAEDFDEE